MKALTAARHDFAFAWNNSNHGGGGAAMQAITQYYPAEKLARNRSYPAFANSSLDHNLGNGDPQDGDLEGASTSASTGKALSIRRNSGPSGSRMTSSRRS